jgi:hypothetical protein
VVEEGVADAVVVATLELDGVSATVEVAKLLKYFWYRLSPSVTPLRVTSTLATLVYVVVVPFSNSSSVSGPG